jgi:hypothetical protein
MILSNRMCLVKLGSILLQTFRPKKRFEPGTLRYSLHKHAQASLSSGINLRSVVQLPQGEDPNDWIAVHGKLRVLKSEDRWVYCLNSEKKTSLTLCSFICAICVYIVCVQFSV